MLCYTDEIGGLNIASLECLSGIARAYLSPHYPAAMLLPDYLNFCNFHNLHFAYGDADVQNAVFAGLKSLGITAGVTYASVTLANRHIPWARKNLNYTGRTLIVCGGTVAVHVRSDYRSSDLRNPEEKYPV
uniref:Uncharacterized protein n=1 Tax=Daucus carota subsp. sativus TaxID=79200 RepID=A0A166FRP2_DAUCS